ncbi:hypothetical protein [Amycolatopsis orientalis]|uniref:hypothetical protein n=1 Tax=Amycolatopsis orientalis TaxID=31958 RepID=UPI0003A33C7B|nr:hypothetical protein [Amycolatopsis orientalis]
MNGTAGHETAVRVVIRASDPLTETGIRSWLLARPEFSVVDDAADVLVVAAELLSVAAPVVLLVDEEAGGPAAAESCLRRHWARCSAISAVRWNRVLRTGPT